ncbi:MAG TPA: hypothetical protein VF657_03050 [Actinoplanes sp.]|jgi:hypothetical protein
MTLVRGDYRMLRFAAAPAVVAAEAAADVNLWPIIGAVIVAVVSLAGAVFTASSALRASNANNLQGIARYANERDQQHDARVEAENTRLRQDNAGLVDGRDQAAARYRELQERHARLRLAVIAHGLDPDEITGPRQKGNADAT